MHHRYGVKRGPQGYGQPPRPSTDSAIPHWKLPHSRPIVVCEPRPARPAWSVTGLQSPGVPPNVIDTMKKLILAVSVLTMAIAGCGSTDDSGRGLRPNPVTQSGESQDTPPLERISHLLQEAKQQYDDGHYETSFRMAEQVEDLINEHDFPPEDHAMALNIQGYSLMQLGRLEDYYIKTFGVQRGAMTKFERVLEIRPEDFRATLGLALVRFRRHGDSVRKGESLGQGVIFLAGIREDFRRGYEAEGEAAKELFHTATRKLSEFRGSRSKLHELGYIFRDATTVKPGPDALEKSDWLGSLSADEANLALLDMEAILHDIADSGEVTEDDRDVFNRQSERIASHWGTVRKYWRQRALTDLQAARDAMLAIREDQQERYENEVPNYFWIDRDLTFVFQSLGAFFLDSGLETTRKIAISRGVPLEDLEEEAKRIYIDESFDNWQKTESRRNYEAALSFTRSFIRSHVAFERMRRQRQDDASVAESDNANPFMVDLVTRYRRMMDQLIEEERSLRVQMILEAAAMCIDPLFQINDIAQANTWANEVRANIPDNPLHHFVRATAYFEGRRWDEALSEYQAFMRDSSPVEDQNRRSVARQRVMQCETYVSRNATGGEGAGR